MRKILIGLLVAAALVQTGTALASDVQDGTACRNAADGATVRTTANGASETDRFSVCVNAGGKTVAYAGGEARSENPQNDGFMDTCGAIIVADTTYVKTNGGDAWHDGTYRC